MTCAVFFRHPVHTLRWSAGRWSAGTPSLGCETVRPTRDIDRMQSVCKLILRMLSIFAMPASGVPAGPMGPVRRQAGASPFRGIAVPPAIGLPIEDTRMSPLRIAVAGAGVIGKTHIEAMSDPQQDAHPCRLAAVVDPGEGARALAERHGVPHHADIGALLESGDLPDGVIVATPNATHTPIGIACIERGIPVLVEKPIADTVEAARRLTDAAERAGVPLLVGHHRRHNPILRMAREVIGRGDLGALVTATILYTFLKPDGYFDAVWRREEGGGPILINLIHEIDTLRFLCGDIESLQASSSNRTRGFAVEDTAAVLLRLRNGALATVSLSDAAATPWSWDMTTGESPQFARQHVPTHFFSGTHGSLTVPTLGPCR
ncbi:gfo/Idh/MocA family oxidoreductase [Azospirillum brasilense]|nr:gfo/Idh/MocA family oxidoreductase [Azospirillum brasilense]